LIPDGGQRRSSSPGTRVQLIPASLIALRDASCNADRVSIRCLIVDDNRSFLGAARVLLEREGLAVAGVATTSADARRQAATLHPDIVLVDISLGKESGLDLAQRIAEDRRGDDPVIVLISTQAEDDLVDLIAGSAAAAFLPKADLSASAIHRIVDGRSS